MQVNEEGKELLRRLGAGALVGGGIALGIVLIVGLSILSGNVFGFWWGLSVALVLLCAAIGAGITLID